MRLISSFVRAIERVVDGAPDDNGLLTTEG